MTVIFKGQSPAEEFPTYGRNSTIHGEVELEANASVLRVTVQVTAKTIMFWFSVLISVSSKVAYLYRHLTRGL